jgi:arylsulfatase A-like enzyme
VLVGVGACGNEEPPIRPPNVVLVVLDTLRPDHLDFYGYERETAPFLAELAGRSTVFRHAQSTSSWTAPATASLLTGLHPVQHGVTLGFFVHRARNKELEKRGETTVELNRIAGEVPTLAELLRQRGYRTFGLSANVNVGSEIGFDRGFDAFERLFDFETRLDASAEEVATTLSDWRERLEGEAPTFLYLHLNDPHTPREGRMPWYESSDDPQRDEVAKYDSEIAYLDRVLAGLYADLGWGTDTLLVLVSDHGEEFWEHGRHGHAVSLYGEVSRILLMVHFPGRVREGKLVPHDVSIVDVLPTILDLIGADTPAGTNGLSLSPLLTADADAAHLRDRPVFGYWFNPLVDPTKFDHLPNSREIWSVVHDGWRLIQSDSGVELFDESTDPLDTVDVSADRADRVEELVEILQRFRSELTPVASDPVDVELDDDAVDALRELGYAE